MEPSDIDPERELIIRDVNVVDWSEAEAGSGGRLALETLLQGMSPDGKAKTALLSWLSAWDWDGRPSSDPNRFPPGKALIHDWRLRDKVKDTVKDEDWEPDFRNAPFRLLAIVNRIDRRSYDPVTQNPKHPAEARFVFCFTGGSPKAQARKGTVIFEYEMAAADLAELVDWAKAWHQLGAIPQFNDDFRKALATLTTRFTRRNAAPSKQNGSALLQIRTNELFLNDTGKWVMREFRLDHSGNFVATELSQTPDAKYQNDSTLSAYLNGHEKEILDQSYVVPASFLGQQAMVKDPNVVLWQPPNVSNRKVRYQFALNTCSGCHGAETHINPTSLGFTHIGVREAGHPAPLSDFLSDIPATDPIPPATPYWGPAEIPRRRAIMAEILNGNTPTFLALSPKEQLTKKSPGRDPLLLLLSRESGRAH